MNHKVVVNGVEFDLIFEEVIHGNAETLKCGSIEFGRVSDRYWIPFFSGIGSGREWSQDEAKEKLMDVSTH